MNHQANFLVPGRFRVRLIAALLAAAAFGSPQAAPVAPQVVSGSATFAQQGNVFSITNSPNAIINWQSFNINAGEVTRFIQQSGDSAVLNRIVGQDPSRILGALQSNGHVFLINPNGIMFGRESRVDVNGLTASTLGISNADFLAGKNNFQAGATAGRVDHHGAITTPSGGKVFLIASGVTNNGIITSPQGQVVLAAGHSVQLVDSANPDLHVVVSAPADQAINLGQVMSQGGRVGIYGALVNQRGVINADSAQLGANGKIVLRASRDSMLEAGSITSASSATSAGVGGSVTVEGQRVGMTGNAAIDVSGAAGGGTVLIGGSYQGKNPLVKNAQFALMGKNATIRADALGAGNGGSVVVWGDASTRAQGRISARGGPLAGNGGLIETSGKVLDVNGIMVDASAQRGASGTWLLDPYDIDIVAFNGIEGLGDVDQFADPASFATINASTISSVAAGTNVVLQATHDIRFSAPVSPALGSAGSLTAEAGNDILVGANINTGGGALRLTANAAPYASGNGAVTVAAGALIDTDGGNLALEGAMVNLAGALVTRNGNVTINGIGQVTIAQNLNTGNGNLFVTANGIELSGAGSADTGKGAMVFNSMGGLFNFGSSWHLASANSINVFADAMVLQGTIGGAQMQLPVLNLRPFTSTKDIWFSVANDTSALQLDANWLKTLPAASIVIGDAGHLGNIVVQSEYSGGVANHMRLITQGDIMVNKPIIMPANGGGGLELQITGPNSVGRITTAPDNNFSAFIPGGRLSGENVILRANNMSIGASVTGTGAGGGTVMLMPHTAGAQVLVGGAAADAANVLGLQNSELALIGARSLAIGDFAGQLGDTTVVAAGADFSAMGPATFLMLQAGLGNVNILGNLVAPDKLFLQGSSATTAAGARVKAQSLYFDTTLGIGASAAPFVTETAYLAASNAQDGGVAPINISNTGTLELGSVHQNGAGNQGAISITNAGGMRLPELDPDSGTPASVKTNGSGNILLKTMSPLTIDGTVATDTGSITLEAGNGGLMTIGATGLVLSNAGNIGVTAGNVVNNGSLSTTTGNINVAANSVSGSGTFLAPGGVVTGVVPTVVQCIANSALAGCAAILKTALDACIVDSSGPNCAALLPTLASCVADKTIYGCSAVLPTLAACVADKTVAGCSVVLPTLAVCVADKTIAGCSVVLPTLAVCTADKTVAGCSAVLPTLAVCVADPGVAGCTVVLPTLAVCTADKTVAGCSAVLPTLAVCVANPAVAGCSVVLPALTVCIADPSKPGCSVVLPTLAACIADPSKAGCAVVLPTLSACIADPARQGCVAVLPTVSSCVANPTASGCSAVLPSLATCIANSSTQGCAVVLPTLSACIANPALGGCSAVLPTLSQCVVTPSTPGCAVVLPTLAQCVASPSLQGCTVVLPPVSVCLANPTAPGCAVIAPPVQGQVGGELAAALVSNVVVLAGASENAPGAPDKTIDSKTEEDKTGVKINEIRKKTYCN